MAPEGLAQVLGERQLPKHPDLIVGAEGAEDAGVLRIAPDRALVFTTDFFPPVVDDPYTYGLIAAANSLSDIYAMGAKPLAALNICAFPSDLDPAILAEILAGGAAKVTEAGAAIAGGHTVTDKEIKYGLAVTGEVHPDRVIRNRGLKPNDYIILTKPIGTGFIVSSIKGQANDWPEVGEAIRWMTTLNAVGMDAILEAAPHALTDVTGFGLLGHLSEMLAHDPLRVVLRSRSVPRIKGVERCFQKNCRTRAGATNLRYVGSRLNFSPELGEWDREILLDPQTSGGLLIAVPPSRAEPLVRRLKEAGLTETAVIASVEPSPAAELRVLT